MHFLTKHSEMQEIHGGWSPNNIILPIICFVFIFVFTFLEILVKSLLLLLGICIVYYLILIIYDSPTLVMQVQFLTWIK